MNSIYDNIKTAAELVSYVSVHGLSLKDEDICRVQDIFGNSTIGELADLANDIGRCNEKGEPDPNGSWSSGRKGTRNTFYSILFNIWNYEDAVRFWNMHTNPEHEQLKLLKKERDEKDKKIAELQNQLEIERYNHKSEETAWSEDRKEIKELEESLHDRDMTIMQLKAELYDLMKKVKMYEAQ